MADQIIETQEAVTTSPNGAVRNTVTAQNSSVGGATYVERLINFIVGILLAILAVRFVLSLLGANQDNAFANLVYSISYPFVAPFFGLFGYTVKYGVARFELETIVAMVVYAMVGFGIAKLVTLGRNKSI
jgi:YggT family protein